MHEDNLIADKTKQFAVRIIRLYQYIVNDRKEYVLSKQVLRSGTSIGANVREALQGQSKKDFRSKMNIALKEATETNYWLELLYETDYLNKTQFESINNDCTEIIRILISIVKNTNLDKPTKIDN